MKKKHLLDLRVTVCLKLQLLDILLLALEAAIWRDNQGYF